MGNAGSLSAINACDNSIHSIIETLESDALKIAKLTLQLHLNSRAITGTWRGTLREKLYSELGWESLNCRRWSRRLTLLYKIINNLTPVYTKDPIPPLQQSHYSLCNQDVVGQIKARTEKFKSSFYPRCLSEWNELHPEIRLAPSVAVFKKKLLSIIRPPARSIFGIQDPIGLSYLTQLRVGLSHHHHHQNYI